MAHSPCFSPLKPHLLAHGMAASHRRGRAARLRQSLLDAGCSAHAAADAIVATRSFPDSSPALNSFTGDA